jgi:GxxExxY protein
MPLTKKYLNDLSYRVIGCAIEVHKQLGPSLLESVHKKCFCRELELRGIAYGKQIWTPIEYKGLLLDTELRLDVLVEEVLCVELKAQEGLLPILKQCYSLTCKCYKSQKVFLSIFTALTFLTTARRHS